MPTLDEILAAQGMPFNPNAGQPVGPVQAPPGNVINLPAMGDTPAGRSEALAKKSAYEQGVQGLKDFFASKVPVAVPTSAADASAFAHSPQAKAALKEGAEGLDRVNAAVSLVNPVGGGPLSRAVPLAQGLIQGQQTPQAAPGTPPAPGAPQGPAGPSAPAGGAPAASAPQGLSISGSLPGVRTQTIPATEVPLAAPGRIAEVNRAVGAEGQAAADVAGSESDEILAKAAGKQQVGAREEEQGRQTQERVDKAAADLAAQRDNLAQLQQQVGQQAKEDPGRFWRNQGTGQKVAYTIALALGSFGSSFLGQKNSVLDMINKHVDDDIAAQRQDFEAGKEKLANARSLYGLAFQATQNHEAATLAAKNMQLEGFKGQVDAAALSAGSGTALAKGQQMKAAADAKIAENNIKLHQYLQPKTVQTGTAGPSPEYIQKRAAELRKDASEHGHEMSIQDAANTATAEWAAAHGLKVSGQAPAMAKEASGDKKMSPEALTFAAPSGERYQARNPESRKKLADATGAYTDMTNHVDDYIAKAASLGTADKLSIKAGAPTAKAAAATTAYYAVLSKERQLQNDGVYKKSEEPMFPKILTPPDAFTGDPRGQANLARQYATQELNGVMHAEDPMPIGKTTNNTNITPQPPGFTPAK